MTVETAERKCQSCESNLPADDFYLVNPYTGRRDRTCKECRKARIRERSRSGPGFWERQRIKELAKELLESGKKKCGRCAEHIPVEDFYKLARNTDGLDSWCKRCRCRAIEASRTKEPSERPGSKHQRTYYRTPRGRAVKLFHSCRARARSKGWDFDLECQDICERVLIGKCEVTGIRFDITPGSPWAPSLDRIDSRLGYTKNNVQVCVTIYNLAKNEWGEDAILTLSRSIIARSING